MTQLAEYRALVRLKGYDGADDTDHLDPAIHAARRRVVSARRWRCMESTSAALSTIAATSTVSLTAITDLAHVDAVRIVVGGVERDLDFMELQDLRREQARRPSTYTPLYWTRRNNELVLYPTPDIVYTLNVDYVANVDTLADGVDDVLGDELQDLVAWAAVPDLAFRQRDAGAMQIAEAQYQTLLRAAGGQENIQQRQGSRQVKRYYG